MTTSHENRTDKRSYEHDRDHFKGKEVVGQEGTANGFYLSVGKFTTCLMIPEAFEHDHHLCDKSKAQDEGGASAHIEGEDPFFFLHIEKHDHEEEQHHDRTSINQNLDRGKKLSSE